MGEIAEMHLDGTLCERCGEFLNHEPLGYPDYCASCKKEIRLEKTGDKPKKTKGSKYGK